MLNGYLVIDGEIDNVALFNNQDDMFDEYIAIDPSLNATVGDFYVNGQVVKNRGQAYGFVDGVYQLTENGLQQLKTQRAEELKAERKERELAPINGISVAQQSHLDDIDKYADLLARYAAATPQEQQKYSGMLNDDGSINWTLADDTVRSVTKEELRQTSLTFLIRKATLIKQYQAALELLLGDDVTTEEQINAITLEVSNA